MGDYLNTKLDADQVLRRTYDEPNNRLRVDAEVTAVIGTVDVIINAATDNIAISDGVDFLGINADGSINVNVLDISISAANDSIKIGDGTNFMVVNTDGSINAVVELEAFTGSNPDNVQLVGSLDGTKTGTKYGFVNNVRQQVLAAHDREAAITYADFGTKNQRVIRIDYTSATFPGVTVRKDFIYTFVSNQYRRDDINWSIV